MLLRSHTWDCCRGRDPVNLNQATWTEGQQPAFYVLITSYRSLNSCVFFFFFFHFFELFFFFSSSALCIQSTGTNTPSDAEAISNGFVYWSHVSEQGYLAYLQQKKRLFQLRTFFVRIYSEFTLLSFFLEKNYNLNDAFVKFLSSGKKGAFSFMGISSGMKMRSHRRLFFLLVFALRWCYQPLVLVPCSHSPIFQVTSTPPKAGQRHRDLPMATDLPLPLDLTTSNLLTMHILPSSPCYCRSIHPFFTSTG